MADDTSVNDAVIAKIDLRSRSGGAGRLLTTWQLTAGETLEVWAAGYNGASKYVRDVDVEWTGTGVVRRLSMAQGTNTTFTAEQAGTGAIQADAGGGLSASTGEIAVSCAVLHTIAIRDGPGGAGQPLVDPVEITAGDVLRVYAAAYDRFGNLVGDVPVAWSGTGAIAGRLRPTTGPQAAVVAAQVGTGTVVADYGGGVEARTGEVRVVPGALHHLRIRDAADGQGSEVTEVSLTAGESQRLWAAGYDAVDNYVGDQRVSWTGTGVVAGCLRPVTSARTTLTAGTAGQGSVRANDGRSPATRVEPVTIRHTELDLIRLRDSPDGEGNELVAHTMEVGDSLQIWAAGYDAHDNYVDDVSVSWMGTGVAAGRLRPGRGPSTVLAAGPMGAGTVQADDGFGRACHPLTVTVGLRALSSIVIRSAPGGAGEVISERALTVGDTLQVWAAGCDADGTYIRDVPVTWTGTGVLGGHVSPARGTHTTLSATGLGAATLRADEVHSHIADTATVAVVAASVGMDLARMLLRAKDFIASRLWTFASFGLLVPIVLLLVPGFFYGLAQSLQPIASLRVASIVIVICVPVVVFYMYSLRPDLTRYDHIRQYRQPPGRSLAVWALLFFVIAVFMAFFLSFVGISKESIIGPPGVAQSALKGMVAFGGPWHMLLKLAMTGILAFLPVFMAMAAGMMAAREYGQRLSRRSERPIYADTERLKDKVLSNLCQQCSLDVLPTLSSLKRLENGGIALAVHYRKEPSQRGEMRVVEQLMWQVEADCLGQISKIEPENQLIEVKQPG